MFAEFVVDHGFNALYIGCQVIARMFHVRSNSQLFRRLGVVKPILALNVVCLLFFRMEGRGKDFHCGGVAEMASYGSGSEHGAEDILFLTIEIDLKRLNVFHRSKACLTVLWLEIVVVFRDVTDDVNAPSLVWLPADIGLIVKEIGSVFSSSFQRS